MYSKLVIGLAMAGAASAADIVRRDTGSGGHAHAHGSSSHGSSAHGSSAHGSSAHGSSTHGSSVHGGGHAADTSSSYGAPAASYGAPAASYGAPAQSYGAPAQSYGAPAPSYGAPSYSSGGGYDVGGYEDDFDLSVIIIPLLVLFGLSLLFPTIVNINASTGRKRREAGDEDVSALTDVVERVNDIYMSVVESEECMQRIACEIGGLAEDVGIRENSLTQMGELFVPSKYKSYYKQFSSGQDCHKIKCGSIF